MHLPLSNPPIGRFAPSPTGPLHFGSLVAALGSCLTVRTRDGRWLLRMEDVDGPRCVPGAADEILRQLETLGFAWDGDVAWQSRRSEAYAAALERLQRSGHVFGCACTRREVADSGLARDGSPRYPGTCRGGLPAGREARAWRFAAPAGDLHWADLLQGEQVEDVAHDVGDFVLKRADGLFAYQLAVVVDDAEQGVTEVVRGADLLDSTARQIALQRALGVVQPAYAHLPVACNAAGEKLSKQTLARSVSDLRPAVALSAALRFLGQPTPDALARATVREVWEWALAHWDFARVPRVRSVVVADLTTL
ncbi:tRNA glutamyl-Q(34) synthetase GluQRS [Viridibacterium curvum]|uniref:Glutamyl-Q tRNA(Asp) synthetase n=1 Tax=Viridibacterium curvum TaxID=1101404 RepID=A0ABP9QKC5_9RHOO